MLTRTFVVTGRSFASRMGVSGSETLTPATFWRYQLSAEAIATPDEPRSTMARPS